MYTTNMKPANKRHVPTFEMLFLITRLSRGDRQRSSRSGYTAAPTFQREDADTRHLSLRYDQRTQRVGWLPGTCIEIFLL